MPEADPLLDELRRLRDAVASKHGENYIGLYPRLIARIAAADALAGIVQDRVGGCSCLGSMECPALYCSDCQDERTALAAYEESRRATH